MNKKNTMKIISGGQTGVDRAALDYSLDKGIPCGGWCPKGRKAEDGPIPDRYPLKETATDSYSERTKLNVVESDGTLILYNKLPDRGTKSAIELCLSLNKPVLYHSLREEDDLARVRNWIGHYQIKTLNIAGPRESSEPGIYRASLDFLERLFGEQE